MHLPFVCHWILKIRKKFPEQNRNNKYIKINGYNELVIKSVGYIKKVP